MERSEQVSICGIPHKVRFVDDTFCSDSCHFGQIDYKKCEICISNGMSKEMEEQTLVHEILHGIFFNLGYNDLTGDEKLVQSLASAIYQSFTVKRNI